MKLSVAQIRVRCDGAVDILHKNSVFAAFGGVKRC